jgi:Putative peptidoglycan binding domain
MRGPTDCACYPNEGMGYLSGTVSPDDPLSEHFEGTPGQTLPANMNVWGSDGDDSSGGANILKALLGGGGGTAVPPKVETLRDVQAALTDLGYSPGPVDGIDGPKTKAAVTAYQKAKGLGVDGVAGPQTKAALSADLQARSGNAALPSIPGFQWPWSPSQQPSKPSAPSVSPPSVPKAAPVAASSGLPVIQLAIGAIALLGVGGFLLAHKGKR